MPTTVYATRDAQSRTSSWAFARTNLPGGGTEFAVEVPDDVAAGGVAAISAYMALQPQYRH